MRTCLKWLQNQFFVKGRFPEVINSGESGAVIGRIRIYLTMALKGQNEESMRATMTEQGPPRLECLRRSE